MPIKSKPIKTARKEPPVAKKILAETLQRHADQGIQRMERIASNLTEELGLSPNLALQRGPKKNIQRIFDKAADRYNNRIQDIPDICRVRILFNHPSQILLARKLLQDGSEFRKAWDGGNIEIVEVDDTFLKPKEHGFRGFQIILRINLGKGRFIKGEIQLLHEKMQNTDKLSHLIYQAIREIKDGAKAEGRELTETENETVDGYQKSNKELYNADAKNYGLEILEQENRPTQQKIHQARSKRKITPA